MTTVKEATLAMTGPGMAQGPAETAMGAGKTVVQPMDATLTQLGGLTAQALQIWQRLFMFRSEEWAHFDPMMSAAPITDGATTAQLWPGAAEAWARLLVPVSLSSMSLVLPGLLPGQDDRWSTAWREGLALMGQWQSMALRGVDAQVGGISSAAQQWRQWLLGLDWSARDRRVSAELIHFSDRRQGQPETVRSDGPLAGSSRTESPAAAPGGPADALPDAPGMVGTPASTGAAGGGKVRHARGQTD